MPAFVDGPFLEEGHAQSDTHDERGRLPDCEEGPERHLEKETKRSPSEPTGSRSMAEEDPLSYESGDRTLYHLPPRTHGEAHNSDAYDLGGLVEALEKDGVVVLPNVFSRNQIESFRRAHEENFATVESLVSEQRRQPPPLKPYRHDFDKKRYYLMPHYEIQEEKTGEWKEVIEISPGRLDYTFGMNGGRCDDGSSSGRDDDDDAFGSAEFQRPKILAELMQRLLRADFQSYAGTLTSAGKSSEGPWHRDTYLLFDDETIDIRLPPYYFTVLIPLVAVDDQNGATEFLKGSHKQTCREALDLLQHQPSFQPCASPGSVIVFDGRICHRGGQNQTEEHRTVLYQVWTKMWYNDY